MLTLAHWDHCPETREESLLRAWCQRCHNAYDQPQRQRHAAQTRQAGKALGDWFEEAVNSSEPDYPLVYVWGNNALRAAYQGKRCRKIASGQLGSSLIELAEGYRQVTSRRAIRRATA